MRRNTTPEHNIAWCVVSESTTIHQIVIWCVAVYYAIPCQSTHNKEPTELGSAIARKRLVWVAHRPPMIPPGLVYETLELRQSAAANTFGRDDDRHRRLHPRVDRREERHALAPVLRAPHECNDHVNGWQVRPKRR